MVIVELGIIILVLGAIISVAIGYGLFKLHPTVGIVAGIGVFVVFLGMVLLLNCFGTGAFVQSLLEMIGNMVFEQTDAE